MVFEKVVEVIVDIMGYEPEEIEKTSKIYDELDADSLDISQIVIALENEYKISIDNKFISDMDTVDDLVQHIEGMRL